MTSGGAAALLDANEKIINLFHDFDFPVLLFHGTKDEVIPIEGAK